MSRWFPDVSTEEGIKAASTGGMAGAIAFGVMTLLGLMLVLFAGHLPGTADHLSLAGQAGAVTGIMLELFVALTAAYRFKQRKGLLIGLIALLLFTGEIAAKIIAGQLKPGWAFLYVMILIGLINGLRASWAIRKLGPVAEANLNQIFE